MQAPAEPAILLAGAVSHEIAELARRADASLVTEGPWRLAEGRVGDRRVLLLETGIGPAAAAAAVAWVAGHQPVSEVVNLGSCGSYDLETAPLEAVVAVTAERFGDLGTRLTDGTWTPGEGLGLGPAADPEGWLPLEPLPLPEAPGFPLATGRGLTVHHVTGTDALGAERREIYGALVESMEGAAVALAAARLGIPCAELRGVSNRAGNRDRAGWKTGPAARNAQEVAWAWLEGTP